MESIRVIEVLDFGQSLLSNGNVLKADGTIITKEQYEQAQQMKERNKLDWSEIDVNDFFALLETAVFATKTYEVSEEQGGMSISKMGFAILDSEGEPFYLRSQEFSGSEKFEMTSVNYSQLIYNINRNSTETAVQAFVDIVENLFDTEDQVGSMFSPDSETDYLIKKFIKDGYVWSLVFRNGSLTNIKKGERLHQDAEAKPKASKIADAINNNRFANLH